MRCTESGELHAAPEASPTPAEAGAESATRSGRRSPTAPPEPSRTCSAGPSWIQSAGWRRFGSRAAPCLKVAVDVFHTNFQECVPFRPSGSPVLPLCRPFLQAPRRLPVRRCDLSLLKPIGSGLARTVSARAVRPHTSAEGLCFRRPIARTVRVSLIGSVEAISFAPECPVCGPFKIHEAEWIVMGC